MEMYDARVMRAILFNLGNYNTKKFFIFMHVVKIIFEVFTAMKIKCCGLTNYDTL
jgi:hypothetical protein